MKNPRLNIIISLAVFALLGILVMQFLWMRHAWLMQEADFERKVYDAMEAAVTKQQRQQDVAYVYNSAFKGALDSLPDFQWLTDNISDIYSRGFERIIVKSDSVGSGKKARILIRNDIEEDHQWFKQDSLLEIHEFEFDISDSLININTQQIEAKMDSINIVIQKRLEGLEEHTLRLNQTMSQVKVELEQMKSENELAAFQSLDESLRTELSDRGLDLPFKSRIVKTGDTTDKIAEGEGFRISLLPGNLFYKAGYLHLMFPDRNSFIMGSLWLMVAASLLFSMVVVFIFVFTIRSYMKQKKISEVKTDFINNMTHEFKTPIATISLATDSIENGKVIADPERIRYFTGMIREENKRMNMRVESVLQMSLLDKKDFDLSCTEVDTHNLLRKAAGQFHLQTSRAGGEIILDLSAGSYTVSLDEAHFLNVVFNILDNALKYNDQKPEIRIITRNLSNNQLEIRISDNGIGMDSEILKHVFDKFYRKPSGDIHNVKGFGLGLSYARALVEMMGGQIYAESKGTKGSDFIMLFPLCENDLKTI